MNLVTLITKKSIREIIKEKRFLKFYNMKPYSPGDVIEVIDGNKKSPAIILKVEDIRDMKQQIRKGMEMPKKIKFSKTGDQSDGVIIDTLSMYDIRKYIKDPLLAHKTDSKFLKDFFPRKKVKEKVEKEKKERRGGEVTTLKFDEEKIFGKKFTEKKYHNKMQEQVDRIRTYFGDKATYGIGSFSYYIGFFKNIPYREIDQMFAEAKQSRKPKKVQYKIFWWKIGQYMKNKNSRK